MRRAFQILAVVCLSALGSFARGDANSIYQFGIELPKPANDPALWKVTDAFLWVPPQVKRLRAVLLAPANILERQVCDDPIIRQMAAKQGLAILFFQSALSKQATDADVVHYVQTMLEHLADISWIPIGHSGNSVFVARIARQAPDRTLCTIVIKGGLQQPTKEGSIAGLADMPMLFFHGEYEEVGAPKGVRNYWWPDSLAHVDILRAAVPHALINGVLDRSYGHIWWSPELSRYIAMFVEDSMAARMPSEAASPSAAQPALRPVSWDSGWLIDRAEQHPSAPVAQYTGDPKTAFWVFDQSMADAWKKLYDRDQGKKDQMLAFVQDGQIAPWWSGWIVQDLKFEPEADGDTFKVKAIFRDAIPKPLEGAGTPLGHGEPSEIYYKVLGWSGQTGQIGPDTFAVRFDREGVNGRTLHILIGAVHPGDQNYKATVAVGSMTLPGPNSGKSQQIAFAPISDVDRDTREIPLKATTDSGLPVHYYVSWGPARLDGQKLLIDDVPSGAHFPIEVKITAYQWGKAGEFAAARAVTQTFAIK
jgi:pimeloyl-ACP methyl ester carboxylesterase